MPKKRAFIVLDSETTKKNGLVFDAGWRTIDRKGNIYGTGSYIFKDVLVKDDPWYRHKIASYWDMAYEQKVTPVTFETFRIAFNKHIAKLREDNFDPIVCAYNAAFDTRVLSKTSMEMLGLRFLDFPVQMLCIWHAWSLSCPVTYTAEKSEAGNLKTSAEAVFRYEAISPDFIEAHTAFADTEIEAFILLKTLARKKKLPIVNHPSEFNTQPWRLVQERVASRKEVTKEVVKDSFVPLETVPTE